MRLHVIVLQVMAYIFRLS